MKSICPAFQRKKGSPALIFVDALLDQEACLPLLRAGLDAKNFTK
jgi:hypothetical protein